MAGGTLLVGVHLESTLDLRFVLRGGTLSSGEQDTQDGNCLHDVDHNDPLKEVLKGTGKLRGMCRQIVAANDVQHVMSQTLQTSGAAKFFTVAVLGLLCRSAS